MSIISGNRKLGAAASGSRYVDAMVRQAMTQPSKRELRDMLAEAARNTASAQVDNEADEEGR